MNIVTRTLRIHSCSHNVCTYCPLTEYLKCFFFLSVDSNTDIVCGINHSFLQTINSDILNCSKIDVWFDLIKCFKNNLNGLATSYCNIAHRFAFSKFNRIHLIGNFILKFLPRLSLNVDGQWKICRSKKCAFD